MNDNTEIVLYWVGFSATERKQFNLDLIQRYSGECYQKPHSAYEYYNNDQKVWVTPIIIF